MSGVKLRVELSVGLFLLLWRSGGWMDVGFFWIGFLRQSGRPATDSTYPSRCLRLILVGIAVLFSLFWFFTSFYSPVVVLFCFVLFLSVFQPRASNSNYLLGYFFSVFIVHPGLELTRGFIRKSLLSSALCLAI